jgi:hypothetical protein
VSGIRRHTEYELYVFAEVELPRTTISLAAALLIACAAGDESADTRDWTTTRATVGDTTVVRTTGGSASSGTRTLVTELSIGSIDAPEAEYSFGQINEMDVGPNGEIYIFDRQVPALRMYDTAGRYVRTLGRKGRGPGEYEQVSGLAVHGDGRVALWDGTTARMNIYAPTGEFLAGWPFPGGAGFFSSRAVFIDTAGFTYARARIGNPPSDAGGRPRAGFSVAALGLLKWAPDGTLVDSLEPPVPPTESARLMASSKNMMMVNNVPFTPTNTWTWSPLGYAVSASTGLYAITLHRSAGGPLRVEREIAPIAVQSEERANQEEVVTASLRRVDPSWRWTGPSIPDTKPFLQSIRVARDGRLWVMVSQRGERIPDAEMPPPPPAGPLDPASAPPRPQTRWREPAAYDVFQPDGEFLGRVVLPARTTLFTMEGDRAWGVTRDSLDVQQITRFRVTPGLPR